MAERKPQPDSREALIAAAKKVFGQKGLEGATVKDLADEANVNVSLISYHFGGKEGLYRKCIEGIGLERVETAERILGGHIKSKDEVQLRLRLFAEDFIAIYHHDPDTCKMIHCGMESLDEISADVFKSVFYRIFVALHLFIENAQRAKLVRKNIDSEVTTSLMFGSLTNILRSQDLARLLGKRTLDEAPYRELVVKLWVESFTEGIFA